MSSCRRIAILGLSVAAAVLAPFAAGGQNSLVPPYRPGLGDLMTMTVQPRHLKAGLAGQQRNWTYAAYELHELEEALEVVTKAWPKWRELSIIDLMQASVREPIEALEQAAKAKNAAQFDEAYSRLTDACNACHRSANVGFIAIQEPRSSPFANQDFRPVSP